MYHVIEPEIRIMHLDEYVEFVNENVNTDDIASIEETSWALGALANDRHFVLDEFHNELKANMEGGLTQSVFTSVCATAYPARILY